jgi:3-dehydroquinate synthase/shikimate kinase/3-dehydroquinate synthase
MKNTKIIVKTGSKNYPIYLGNKILNFAGFLIRKNLPNVKKVCIISDKNLPPILLKNLKKSLKKYEVIIYKLPSFEKIKSFKVAYKLAEKLIKNNFNRSDCIISLGGGILGDLSAFVASITKRGLKFVNIPTTLLAQVDASVGGKTGINSIMGKNLMGTFYQPDFVLSDMLSLKSLPRREMICGYGEILKHSLISDRNFFLWLNKNAKKIINNKDNEALKFAIHKSCKIKSTIISKDEKEKNLRMILNFGHTFGHGFEGAKNFSKKLNHGEAVLLGMIMASKFSYDKKILSLHDFNLIKKHYLNLNLPMNINKIFKKKDINKIIKFAIRDKKNLNEKINLILLNKIGKAAKPNQFHIKIPEFRKFLLSNFK